jgi:hypothetical protein
VPQKEQAGQGHRLRLWTAYENPLPGVLKNGYCLCYRRRVIISFCNRTELLRVGLDVRLMKTPHLFPGLPGHPTSLHVTFSSGAILKIKFTCPLYQEIYQSVDRESWLQLIPSMLICCNVCGKSYIKELMSVESPEEDIWNICKVG